uniref:t-SNARE coiled-coil homology domain-containing protein n=2 Tax=Timema TaxID=61471 RepID=A0A7R9D2D3_TIMCR|nr:unnamed protein product [Timema cristinae]
MYSPLEFPNMGVPELDKRFTGVELRAALNRVQHTLVGPDNVSYVVLCDFRCALESLSGLSSPPSHPLIIQIHEECASLRDRGYELGYQWIPSHLPPTSFEFISIISMAACLIWQFELMCSYANAITLESFNVGQAAYSCSWYDASPTFKFRILNIIRRSQKPATITAGMFGALSLVMFTNVGRIYLFNELVIENFESDNLLDQLKMDGNYSFSSYHNGGPGREKDFQKLAQTIGTSIQKISQNVLSMQKMVIQLDTPQDTQELRNQLHQIQHYTQQLAKDTSANLKDLSSLPAPMSTSEQRQWKMQKERLADEFTSALNTFQATQRRAAQKEKDQMQRVRANSGLNDPFANLSKAGLGGRYTDQLIELQDSNTGSQQQDQMMDEMNLQLLEEQEQGIRQLESDISDVNQIFKELGAMVHEQGEVIDSIEAHVEKTEVFVSEGNTQLRQASTYQNKVRGKKCMLAVCLAVVLTVIIGIILWKTSG